MQRSEGDAEIKGSIAQAKSEVDATVTVNLAVASRPSERRERGGRYRETEGGVVTDILLAESEVQIQRLQPMLSLRLGRRPPAAEFTSLPIARLRSDGSKFVLDRDFVPPTLSVSRDSPLGRITGDIAAMMRSKAEKLWVLESSAPRLEASQLLAARVRVASLLAGVPKLEKLMDTQKMHPFVLYQAICDAAGPIAMLRREMPLPPDLPTYRHEDPLETFHNARLEIEKVIAESVSERYTPYRFQLTDGRFDLQQVFQDSWRGHQLLLGLSRGSLTEKETSDWLDQAHIGALDTIDTLRDNRDPGAHRSPLSPGEADLVPARDVVLFKLDAESAYIAAEKQLTILNPGGTAKPREIVLYVRNGDGRG